MQNNTSDRHEIHAYPVTQPCTKHVKIKVIITWGKKRSLAHTMRCNSQSNRGK